MVRLYQKISGGIAVGTEHCQPQQVQKRDNQGHLSGHFGGRQRVPEGAQEGAEVTQRLEANGCLEETEVVSRKQRTLGIGCLEA